MKKIQRFFGAIKDWEAWPFKLLYAPLSFCWLWYTIKSGHVWFFTSSNPKLTFGGMEGEPKKEMYNLLHSSLYPTTFNVLPNEDFSLLQKRLIQSQITYPFIVKPEVGSQGILLRKIDNEAALRQYHSLMPWEYIVQNLVLYPMEVSVFYIRHPKTAKGMITGFLHKIPLQVVGNGKQPLSSLIKQHSKGANRVEELFNKHKDNWDIVLPAGEKYILSYAANHNRGARFIDLKDHITDQMVGIFDEISIGINDFFYGRYDIMCSNLADFKVGKKFTILEFNGCGAEPNHFYDTGYTLLGAYKEILKHWKALYEISKYNRLQGIAPWPFMKGNHFMKSAREHIVEMKKTDEAMG
jgi:hypothetical protein